MSPAFGMFPVCDFIKDCLELHFSSTPRLLASEYCDMDQDYCSFAFSIVFFQFYFSVSVDLLCL